MHGQPFGGVCARHSQSAVARVKPRDASLTPAAPAARPRVACAAVRPGPETAADVASRDRREAPSRPAEPLACNTPSRPEPAAFRVPRPPGPTALAAPPRRVAPSGTAPRDGGWIADGRPAAPPLILTLQFDEALTERFEAMRRSHFPAALNRIPAHLTLFHQLPGDEEARIVEILASVARRPAFPVSVTGLMPLGRGVAYVVEAPPLLALRRDLATRFAPWLVGQDRQRFRPHVTIQNKVTPAEARATLERLASDFAPFGGWAEGLQLWRYAGGPWRPAGAIPFRAA